MKKQLKNNNHLLGAYNVQVGTKKKTGLTSEQIKAFFGDKKGRLLFAGQNRRSRRNPVELMDGRYTKTTRAGIVKPLFSGKHKKHKLKIAVA